MLGAMVNNRAAHCTPKHTGVTLVFAKQQHGCPTLAPHHVDGQYTDAVLHVPVFYGPEASPSTTPYTIFIIRFLELLIYVTPRHSVQDN